MSVLRIIIEGEPEFHKLPEYTQQFLYLRLGLKIEQEPGVKYSDPIERNISIPIPKEVYKNLLKMLGTNSSNGARLNSRGSLEVYVTHNGQEQQKRD